MADLVLTMFLYVALAFALGLALISTAMAGRKIADLEYQIDSDINGVHRIQSWTNLRTHANRVLLACTFIVITVLLIANASIDLRTWTNRVLFMVVMVSYFISSVMDWRAERMQVKILKIRSIASHEGDHDRAFSAGVHDAEGKAETKAEDLAIVTEAKAEALALTHAVPLPPAVGAIVNVAPGAAPVDVETISPEAAQSIADAARSSIRQAVGESVADALPSPHDEPPIRRQSER